MRVTPEFYHRPENWHLRITGLITPKETRMPKTDRTKHPQCRHCRRTIEVYRIDPFWDGVSTVYISRWRHKKSQRIACTPITTNRIAAPPDDWKERPPHKGKPRG